MYDITWVRSQMEGVLEDLNNGNVKPSVAAEKSNAAGKIIQSLKVQVDYQAMRKKLKTPRIKYLEEEQKSTD